MKFNLYSSIWLDPAFYIAAGVFALALFLAVFSIRKYLEIKNGSDFEEPGAQAEEVQGELPLSAVDVTGVAAEAQSPVRDEARERAGEGLAQAESPAQPAAAAAVKEPEPAAAASAHASSKAEEFVKGLYQNMASLDSRLKNIEAAFSKMSVNRDFTVTFLEDIISDFDSLDKEKIKARIEYLVSDLKK